MHGAARIVLALTWVVLASAAATLPGRPEPQAPQGGGDATLPPDVHPDSRSRLPLIRREDLDERGRKAYDAAVSVAGSPDRPQGAAAIRLHGSGVNVRWASPLGRALTELAILITAREHDQPYEWSLHEMEAVAVGLDPAIIDVVRQRKALAGVPEQQAVVIQTGREIFGAHQLSSATYARALKELGKSNLVDVLDLMATYSGTAARLTAFNQQMPPGWKQFLPLPFTPSDDIHPDSRSRLPLMRAQAPAQQAAPNLYARTLAPEGTGPTHIARHGAGLKSLETSRGRRLIALATLVAAREHDAQYQWTATEPAAVREGLEPRVIDAVRHRAPLTDVGRTEAALIQFGRELFARHNVSRETYAAALKIFGERDLVDVVAVMAQSSTDAVLLTAFDQHTPAGQKPLLPVPGGVK